MTPLRRRALRGLGTVGALAALTMTAGGTAWAHECFNASRSAQGNASAGAHSAAWQVVTLHTILTDFIGLPPDLAACVEAKAPAAGVPDSFVFGGKQSASNGVIALNNTNMVDKGLATNGRGIDHAASVYGPVIFGLIGQCTAG